MTGCVGRLLIDIEGAARHFNELLHLGSSCGQRLFGTHCRAPASPGCLGLGHRWHFGKSFLFRIPFLTRAVGSGFMRLTASGKRTYEHESLDRHPRTDPALYSNGRGVAVGIMTGSENTFAVYHRRLCIVQPDMLGFVVGLGTDPGRSQS